MPFSLPISAVVYILKSPSLPSSATHPPLLTPHHSLRELIQFSALARKAVFASGVNLGWALLKLLIYFYSSSLQPGVEQWDQKCSRHIVCLIKEHSSSWTVCLLDFLVWLVNPWKQFGLLLLELAERGDGGASKDLRAPLVVMSLVPWPWPLISSKALLSVNCPPSRELVKAVKLTELPVLCGPRRNGRMALSEFQPLWLWEGCWFYYWSSSLIWCISQRLGSVGLLLAPGAAATPMTSFSVPPARCKSW